MPTAIFHRQQSDKLLSDKKRLTDVGLFFHRQVQAKNILKEHAGKCRINKKKKNSAKIVSLRERIGCAVMVLTDNSNYLQ